MVLPIMLYSAVYSGNLALVKRLLEGGDDVNGKIERTVSYLLHVAATSRSPNSAAIIELLLRAGAEVDSRGSHGFTPLMVAAYHDDRAAVRALLDAGAELGAKNNGDLTALDIALDTGSVSYDLYLRTLSPK